MTLDTTTELCRLLGDSTRLRLLAILAHEELTVAEITQATQLAQSRVSTHLGKLREAGLVRDRRAGNSSYYVLNEAGMPEMATALWGILRQRTDDPLLAQDRARVEELIVARDGGTWADSVAGNMARHYSPGRTWEATARGLLGLADVGRVLDVASGDGAIAELLSIRAPSITCLDHSARVVRAGARRLGHLRHVHFARGDMMSLPFEHGAFDDVLLMNALTLVHRPDRVISEAVRVLAPGGRLVGVTLRSHDHRDAVAAYNHVHMGFEPTSLAAMIREAGLHVEICEVRSRETRPPYFEVITFHARRPGGAAAMPIR